MFDDSWETNIHLDRVENSQAELRSYMIEKTAARLVEVTSEFADGGVDDWRAAIHVDGPDGDHSLIAVEAELAGIMESRSSMVDAMRDSIEWDEEIFSLDTQRAARALVNESLEMAEALWAERRSTSPEA
jgi:hypothetical protein